MNIVHLAYPVAESVLRSVPAEGQTMAIGDFDGVHLGHREVIGRAVAEARRLGLPSSVMTFHPHPREVLGSPLYSTYLSPPERKLERFRELGVDTVYIVAFDLTLAALPPAVFVEDVLKPLGAKSIAVGFNFTFGRRGIGTSAMLRELGNGAFDVHIVPPFLVEGERVSSTLIREALSFGKVERAATLLGRPYEVDGVVVRGEGRGRTIGVPTANVAVPAHAVKPANGVYAVDVVFDDGTEKKGVMNVGLKPTFHSALPAPTWEVHVFEFEGDLYGRALTIRFRSHIRDERKFESVGALIEQIRADIEEAKRRNPAQV